MSGFQRLPLGECPTLQPWVLRTLGTVVSGLREQNSSGNLTHESFYFVVEPFLELAQFSPEQKAYFKNGSAQQQQVQTTGIESDLPELQNTSSVFNSQVLRELMSIRESLDKKRNERENHEKYEQGELWNFEVLEAAVDLLRDNEGLDLKTFDRVVRQILRYPERVLGLELISQMPEASPVNQPKSQSMEGAQTSFDDRDEEFNDGGINDQDLYNAEDAEVRGPEKRKRPQSDDSSPSQGKAIHMANESSCSNKRQKLLVESGIRNSKLLQDLLVMMKSILVKVQKKARMLTVLYSLGVQTRKNILLRWSKTIPMPEDHQVPTSIRIEDCNRLDKFQLIVSQLRNGQLTKNWVQYTRLRDDWVLFCNFLDSATNRALRSASFRQECAAWMNRVHEPARYCYQNGMGLLNLPWSSVARFMGLLKIWELQNQDRTDADLVKILVGQLGRLLWYNHMRYMGPDSFPNRAVEPQLVHFAPSKCEVVNVLEYRPAEFAMEGIRQKEDDSDWHTIKNQPTSCTKDQPTLEIRYWDFEGRTPGLDLSYIVWLAYQEENRDDIEKDRLLELEWLSVQHQTDLDVEQQAMTEGPVNEEYFTNGFGRLLPRMCSHAAHPKEYYVRQCLSALWVLSDNATDWGTNWARRPDKKLGLYRLVLLPLCRSIYTLLKFEIPADELRSVLHGSRELRRDGSSTSQSSKALLPLLLRLKAAEGIDELSEDSATDGLSGVDLLDMIDYIIDISVDSQAPSKDWPGPQLQVPRPGIWFFGKASDATEIDALVPPPLMEDGSHIVNDHDVDEECAVEDNGDSDSVCSEDSFIVTININDENELKPKLVCKSWFNSFGKGLPQKCKWEGTNRRCLMLHPDISRPGLCRDWLNNRCNDVHCDLAHDDPMYPRNMYVVDIRPARIPGRQAVCKFWQSDKCGHGESCWNLHQQPNKKNNYMCPFLESPVGCRNLGDRCTYSHDASAPGQPSLYHSNQYDPNAPPDQPDRRPISLAQPTAGGGVRILCRNMLLTGWCWRGADCWLEHKTDGVKVTNQNEPIVLTVQECSDFPNCPLDIHCDKFHPGTNMVKFDPNNRDLCPFYYKFGSCRFNENQRCKHSLHFWAASEIQTTGTKRPALDAGNEPRKRPKQDIPGDTSPAAPKISTPVLKKGQSVSPAPARGAKPAQAYVNQNLFSPFTPEMFGLMGPANFPFLQSGGAVPYSLGQQGIGAQCQYSPSSVLGPNAGSNQWQPQPFSARNSTSPVCHYCNGVGHIKRYCPQKQRDDLARRTMAPSPNAVPGAYGQRQTPSGYMRQPYQMMPNLSPFSSAATPKSQPFSQQMAPSTPMTAPSPHLRHQTGNQNVQRPQNAQLTGTPTPAPRPVSRQAHPQPVAPESGLRSVPRQPRTQTLPPRGSIAYRKGVEQPQQDNKRKRGGNDFLESLVSKRHRSAGADQGNKRSESIPKPLTESLPIPQPELQTESRVRKSALSTYKPPPQQTKRPAKDDLDSNITSNKRHKPDNKKNETDDVEQEKRRKRALRFRKPPAS